MPLSFPIRPGCAGHHHDDFGIVVMIGLGTGGQRETRCGGGAGAAYVVRKTLHLKSLSSTDEVIWGKHLTCALPVVDVEASVRNVYNRCLYSLD